MRPTSSYESISSHDRHGTETNSRRGRRRHREDLNENRDLHINSRRNSHHRRSSSLSSLRVFQNGTIFNFFFRILDNKRPNFEKRAISKSLSNWKRDEYDDEEEESLTKMSNLEDEDIDIREFHSHTAEQHKSSLSNEP